MKAYPDKEQCKKLKEFLPIDTADMRYTLFGEDPWFNHSTHFEEGEIPCWSLAALLNLLPNEISTADRFECKYEIHIRKYEGCNNITYYQIAYGNNRGSSGSWHDLINTGERENLIDAAYYMLLDLYKSNFHESIHRHRTKQKACGDTTN